MPEGPAPNTAGSDAFALQRRNVRYSNLNGIAAALATNMVNPFLGIFAVKLGATNLQIGLMSSLPALFSLLCAIPGGRVLDRAAHKQVATCGLVIAARIFFIIYALAPAFGGSEAAWFLVLAVALTSLPSTLANVAFQSLLADALTPQGRARALAARTRLIAIAGIVPLLLVGRLLDVLRYPFGYQLIFCSAFGIGVVEALLLLRLTEIPASTGPADSASSGPAEAANPRRGATLTEVLANREFVQFDMASFVLYLGWGMAGPLWTRYRVSIMGANNTWISIYSVVEALASFGALYYWARLGERRGSRNVLWWVTIALAGNVWTLASIVDLRIGVITPLWCGIFNSGANLFLFNSLLEIIPANRRASYIAYHTTVINLAHLGGPLVAVAIMNTLGIRPALIISGFIRAIGGLVFLRFRPKAGAGTAPSR